MLIVPNQQPIEWQVQEGERGPDDGGGESVASRVEASRQDVLCSPGKHPQGEDGQRRGGGFEVGRPQARVGKNQVDKRRSLRDRQRGNRHEQQDQALHRGIQRAVQFFQLAF